MQIVRTTTYLKDLKRMGLSASDQTALERAVASNPQAGDVIKGLSGVRKIRFGMAGRGKRGGGRAIYFLMIAEDAAIMLRAYAKNEQADLSAADRKAINAVLKELSK